MIPAESLKRTVCISAFMFLFVLIPVLLFPSDTPVRNRRTVPGRISKDLPRQGHAAPPFFTLDIEIEQHALLKRYVSWYRTAEGTAYLNRVLERGKPFRDHIAAAIGREGMPPELLFLPVVESAFREDAVSRSGAAGLWQFMMNSIDPYPITVDSWRDERRDFWKSTDAALHKLAYNYEKLGDWLLAIAAYNCGLGRVQRTVAASGISDFWELSEKKLLPSETIHYVPRFLAAAYIASHPGRNGLDLNWEEPLLWQQIPLKGQVSLSLLAAKTQIDRELLSRGNAELFYGVTPPSEGYLLKVPVKEADIVKRVILTHEREQLMKYTVHSIGAGDTLYALSEHFGVPVSLMLQSNPGLIPEKLRVGARIVIPVIKEVGPFPGKTTNTAGIDAAELSSFTASHTVGSGETLWAIAKRYGTSPEALAEGNGLAMTDIIYPGHILKVPEAANPSRGEEIRRQ